MYVCTRNRWLCYNLCSVTGRERVITSMTMKKKSRKMNRPYIVRRDATCNRQTVCDWYWYDTEKCNFVVLLSSPFFHRRKSSSKSSFFCAWLRGNHKGVSTSTFHRQNCGNKKTFGQREREVIYLVLVTGRGARQDSHTRPFQKRSNFASPASALLYGQRGGHIDIGTYRYRRLS